MKKSLIRCAALLLSCLLLLSACSSVEKKSSYELKEIDNLYYFYIYDSNGKTLKSEGPFTKQPRITDVSENIILFTVQAGTGLATNWGFFYDLKSNTESKIYKGIFDCTPTLVAYGASLSVNVSEIFNNGENIQVFDSFSKEFSKSAEPINSAKFINGGKQIEITYLSGEDYSRITEVKGIDLNSGK